MLKQVYNCVTSDVTYVCLNIYNHKIQTLRFSIILYSLSNTKIAINTKNQSKFLEDKLSYI